MREIKAGAMAGAVAGLLLPTLEVGLFFATGGRMRVQDLASITALGFLPLETIVIFFILGFVALSLVTCGLLVVLGVAFSKVAKRLPLSPIYSAPALGILFYMFLSLPRMRVGEFPKLYDISSAIIDSLILGLLFVRFAGSQFRIGKGLRNGDFD